MDGKIMRSALVMLRVLLGANWSGSPKFCRDAYRSCPDHKFICSEDVSHEWVHATDGKPAE